MTAAERQRLRQLVDELQRARLEQQRAAARGKPCAGCGGNRDRYTDGCQTCRDRRNGRAARAREAGKVAIAIEAREAMREHRKGKPIAFDPMWRPRV
jgi:hypothetical protein